MKLKNRLICGLMSMVMLFALTGCSSTTEKYIAEVNGVQIPVGVYLYEMHTAYSEATTRVLDKEKPVFSQEIDGQPSTKWIESTAMMYFNEYLAGEQLFLEANLELTPEDIKGIEDNTEMYWTSYELGDTYTERGISKDSMKLIITNSLKKSKLFEYNYGKDGITPIPETELKAELEKEYLYLSALVIPTVDDSGTPLEGDKLEEAKKIAEDYLSKAKSGTNFDELIIENEARVGTTHDTHADSQTAHVSLLNKTSLGFGEEFNTNYDNAKVGEFIKYEDESSIIIIKKLDIHSDPENSTKAYNSMVTTLRQETFSNVLKAKGTEMTSIVKMNDKALSQYTAKNLRKLDIE